MSYGGVRVETDLLHSQLISSGTNQLLYGLMTFGVGPLGGKPDFDGYAIGDLLLRDFSSEKVKLYYAVGRRILSTDAYNRSLLPVPEVTSDAFSLYWPKASGSWKEYFSGTRSPSTKIQFGCYGPLSNGHRFYLPLELIMVVDGSGSDTKWDSRRKREKHGQQWPRLCGITAKSGNNITYKLDDYEFDEDDDDYKPWGLSDMITFQNESRSQADEALQSNQDFMFGEGAIGRVIRRDRVEPYDPLAGKQEHTYQIRLDDKQLPGVSKTVDYAIDGRIDKYTNQSYGSASQLGAGFPWERSAVQQVAIASLTNNRPCHATEIGIKSEVWRQMTGAVNFNGWPTKGTIEKYEDKGGQITVGTVTKYMKRYSFFKLYVRALGAGSIGLTLRVISRLPFAAYHPQISTTQFTLSTRTLPPAFRNTGWFLCLASSTTRELLDGGTQIIKLFSGSELYAYPKQAT